MKPGTALTGRLRGVLPARADLADMRRSPRRDLVAGVTVALVALPLALGFGITSGLGAQAGLVTAVVAGTLAAVFGGSKLQVSGPTGAMTVVLVPIVHTYGASGVLTVGLLAGILLVVCALARAGRYIRYIPTPVVEGFTVGIAAVIALQQVPAALGVHTPSGDKVVVVTARAVADFAETPHWPAAGLAVGVIVLMLTGVRWRPGWPFALIAVAAATIVAQAAGLHVVSIGHLPQLLHAPSLGFLHQSTISTLLPSVVAVAALAALESLMSATAADAMSVDSRHDPDRELFGQGLANIAAPLFGGVPATGAIARTAVNVRSGGTSRLAALSHAVVLAAIVLAAAPVVARIPVAALAGVLIATAVRMVEVGSLKAVARSTRGDALIMILTAAATLAFNLVTAVIAGMVVAGVLAIRAVANTARIQPVDLEHEPDPDGHQAEEQALLAEHIVAYRIDGPLFFAVAHRFLLELTEVTDVSVVILRMSRITTVDATGARVLGDAITRLEHRGITVLVSGIRPGHDQALDTLGQIARLRGQHRVFDSTPQAIDAARSRLHHEGILPGPRPEAGDQPQLARV